MFQNWFGGVLIFLFIYYIMERTTAEDTDDNYITNEWTEDWHSPPSGNRNLSLSYIDNFVAVYFDEQVDKSTTWPGPLLNKAWKYLQNVYEPFDINFRLNVVLHLHQDKIDNECYILATKNTTFQNKTGHHPPSSSSLLVDCGANSKQSWAVETPQLFERLFFQLAKIIQNMSNMISSDPEGISSCLGYISEIIFYDIYIYLKGYSSAAPHNWKSKRLIPEPYYFGPVNEANCFRDWYYPNYDTYGGAQILMDFFRLTKVYKSSSVGSTNATFTMTDEEFFHFWSQAAGTDLTYWIIPKLRWRKRSPDFGVRLDAAKLLYHFNYTLNDCNLVFIDSHVAVYLYTTREVYPNPTYRTISDGWKYIKTKYGPFTNQSIHTILLLNERNSSSSRLNNQSCTPLINGIQKYKHNFVTVIGTVNYASQLQLLPDADQSEFLDTVFTPIGHLTLKLTQQTGDWPAHDVSSFTMISIIIYDMYLGLGLSFLANHWKESQLRQTRQTDETQWFRDWYLKMYEATTRKKGDTLLESFFFLLNTTWDKKDGNLTKQLNMGEFVHFWSEAAGRNLLNDADISFGWNETFQNQFIQARKEFSSFNYSCHNCDNFHWKSYQIQRKDTSENAIMIVISTSVAVLIIAFIGVLIKCTIDGKRIKKLKNEIQSLTAEELNEFLSGYPGDRSGGANNSWILSVPYNTNFELPTQRLVVDHHRVLGSGEFGFVFHGILKGDQDSGTADVEVAVKTVKPNIEISYFKALLSEIKILTHLGYHENIVSLLGTVTRNIVNREVYIAMELCPKGNLLHYLRRNRHRFQESWSQSVVNEFKVILNNRNDNGPDDVQTPSSAPCNGFENLLTLTTEDLIEWSCQIANGMQYISSKNVIHGDLAARNILLTYENVAKISDFGLSRQLANYSVYQKTSKTPIPWKWLAIESLVDKTFSVHSDVWSFGITLWEIFSLGAVPYPGKCWDNIFVNNLKSGDRLECPEFGNAEIYNLMMNCWKKVPMDRISFQEILPKLYKFSPGFPVGRSSGCDPGPGRSCTYTAL